MMLAMRFPKVSAIAAILVAAGLGLAGSARAQSMPHDSDNGFQCYDCHAIHAGGAYSGIVPYFAQQEALCKSCHNPTGQASATWNVANHEGGVDCGSCHGVHAITVTTDPHTGITAENLSLIRADTSRYVPGAEEPAIFQERPAHFAFADLPYTGICQTCHDGALKQPHNIGQDCAECHTHETGFENP